MKTTPLSLDGLIYVTPRFFHDDRGFFFESYHQEKFNEIGITLPFVQDNQSHSIQGTLRGMHYQADPYAQGKLIRVLSGSIFDVAVDIRPASPTFGKWEGLVLSADDQAMLYIPPGFAHGFYVISDRSDVLYKCTNYYNPDSEKSFRWDDPDIGIEWPILEDTTPKLSPKDAIAGAFKDLPL